MIKVYIQDDFMDGMAISFGLAGDHSPESTGRVRAIARFARPGYRPSWEEYDSENPVNQEPSLRMDSDMARALLEELTRHFHGADDTRQLRLDYNAERARVDRLTSDIASLAAQSGQTLE